MREGGREERRYISTHDTVPGLLEAPQRWSGPRW